MLNVSFNPPQALDLAVIAIALGWKMNKTGLMVLFLCCTGYVIPKDCSRANNKWYKPIQDLPEGPSKYVILDVLASHMVHQVLLFCLLSDTFPDPTQLCFRLRRRQELAVRWWDEGIRRALQNTSVRDPTQRNFSTRQTLLASLDYRKLMSNEQSKALSGLWNLLNPRPHFLRGGPRSVHNITALWGTIASSFELMTSETSNLAPTVGLDETWLFTYNRPSGVEYPDYDPTARVYYGPWPLKLSSRYTYPAIFDVQNEVPLCVGPYPNTDYLNKFGDKTTTIIIATLEFFHGHRKLIKPLFKHISECRHCVTFYGKKSALYERLRQLWTYSFDDVAPSVPAIEDKLRRRSSAFMLSQQVQRQHASKAKASKATRRLDIARCAEQDPDNEIMRTGLEQFAYANVPTRPNVKNKPWRNDEQLAARKRRRDRQKNKDREEMSDIYDRHAAKRPRISCPTADHTAEYGHDQEPGPSSSKPAPESNGHKKSMQKGQLPGRSFLPNTKVMEVEPEVEPEVAQEVEPGMVPPPDVFVLNTTVVVEEEQYRPELPTEDTDEEEEPAQSRIVRESSSRPEGEETSRSHAPTNQPQDLSEDALLNEYRDPERRIQITVEGIIREMMHNDISRHTVNILPPYTSSPRRRVSVPHDDDDDLMAVEERRISYRHDSE